MCHITHSVLNVQKWGMAYTWYYDGLCGSCYIYGTADIRNVVCMVMVETGISKVFKVSNWTCYVL